MGAQLRLVGQMDEERTRRLFSAEVSGALEEGVLRYSRRLALMHRAQKLGIGKFDANLIIALVQRDAMQEAQQRRPVVGRWVVAAIVQGLIVLAAWWVVR